MKKILLFVLLVSALLFSFERLSETQTKLDKNPPEQAKNKPKIIALNPGEPDGLACDAGTVRFLASSEDTGGAWSAVVLKELPGYKTRFH